MGLLIAWSFAHLPEWPRLVTVHLGIVLTPMIIPPRGAAWEERRWPQLRQRLVHGLARFVRHAYPLLLALFLFEEGRFTVNMIFPEIPDWFEPHLYAADAAVFGELPVRRQRTR